MSRQRKYDLLKNTFPFPNDVFLLGLCPGELAVYAYLLRCESRKTHQYWPSYKTIGEAVRYTAVKKERKRSSSIESIRVVTVA